MALDSDGLFGLAREAASRQLWARPSVSLILEAGSQSSSPEPDLLDEEQLEIVLLGPSSGSG